MSQPVVRAAVALGYEVGTPAPKVLAQVRGEVAEALLERAKELGIPTKTEPELVAFLLELRPNDWVPSELFAAVAQVLAWAYDVDGRLAEKRAAVIKPEDS